MNIGQAHIAAAESERRSRMIDPEAVEHGCVQIVDLAFVFDRFVTPFVRGTVHSTTPNATSCEPR